MSKLKVGLFGQGSVQKYKDIVMHRENFIENGADMLISGDTRIPKLNGLLHIDKVLMEIKEIKEITPFCKMISFETKNDKKVALFNQGQYITVSRVIDGKVITRPYTITSTLKQARNGIYSITVEKVEHGIMSTYLVDEAKIGDDVTVSGPFGNFYFNELRDNKNVIALAAGKGITPFLAMAQGVFYGDVDCNLTIIYNCKKEKDIFYKEIFDNMQASSKRIRVRYVLSEEEKDGYDTGFITLEMIKQYMERNYTIFASGSEGFLKYLNKELADLEISRKFIKYHDYAPRCSIKKVKEFEMIVHDGSKTKSCKIYNNKTIMESLEQAGIYIPSSCRVGKCRLCRSILLHGQVKAVNDKRSSAEQRFNYIHPCSTYPLSNLEIRIK